MRGLVDRSFQLEPPQTLLGKSPKVLLGVGDFSARVLEKLGISSVAQLASHPLFQKVAEIKASGTASEAGALRDLLGESTAGDAPSLRTVSPESLRFLEKDVAKDLSKLFPSLNEMADWPPLSAARRLAETVDERPEPAPIVEDVRDNTRPDIPDELVPTARRYATSRETRTRNFIDMFGDPAGDGPTSAPSRLTALSLAALGDPRDLGPALGAQLVLEYELVPEGIALGRLLHSLTLAPGESTNVAIVTFDRRIATDAAEQIRQQENLEAATSQSQQFDSETEANVSETQSGESNVDSESTADSTAAAAAVGLAGGPAVGGAGVVTTTASNTTDTTVTTSSTGTRNADAKVSEDLLRESQQQAASERERSASLVTEVSEAENQRAETRNVTNYNHMHTLSVHYYEVVQIHKLEIRPVRVQPLLFVPTELLDFNDIELVRRFRPALMAAAPDAVTRDLIASVEGDRVVERVSQGTTLTGYALPEEPHPASVALGVTGRPKAGRYKIPRAMRFTELIFRLADGENLPLPTPEAVVFTLIGGRAVRVEIDRDPESFFSELIVSLPTEVFASEVESVQFDFDRASSGLWQFGFSLLFRNAAGQIGGIEFQTRISGFQSRHTVLRLSDEIAFERVIAALNRDSRRYSQAVYGALGPEELVSFFFGRTFAGVDLGGAVEPRIAAQYGHLIGFPFSFDETADTALAQWWSDWKQRNYHPERVLSDFIAKPTAGLHAEGILGRANTAEKLDFTRFWNWQDSPIPNLPPKISDVSMDSRARVDAAPVPGSLDPSVVNIQNLPGLPDPIGATSALNSVLTSAPFRDMSGVSEAGATGRAGIAAATTLASDTAKAAAGLAGSMSNNATELAKTGKIAKTISELASAYNEQDKRNKSEDAEETLRSTTTPGSAYDKSETAKSGRRAAEGIVDTGKSIAETLREEKQEADEESSPARPPAKDYGHVLWLSKVPDEQTLLLYNFPLGSKEQKLHPRHIKALHAISAQIEGVADIEIVEGRASKSKTRSDDKQRKNANLSITRMELVWAELLRFARVPDPQSNIEKQIPKGDTDPVRDLYPAATTPIGKPAGDEDPVERSVLIKLKKTIKPDLEPEPVPGIPDFQTLGHTLIIDGVNGDRNVIHQQVGGIASHKYLQDSTIVGSGDINFGSASGDNTVTVQEGFISISVGDVVIKTNMGPDMPPPPAGDKVQVEADSKPTTKWRIELRDPKSEGVSPGDLLVDLKTAIEGFKGVAETMPSFQIDLGKPELGKVEIKKNRLFTEYPAMADFLVSVLDGEIVGDTLRGLRRGRAEVRVFVFPVFENAVNSSWKKGLELVLSGNGWQFKRQTGGDDGVIDVVSRFDYETNKPFRLREWGSNSELSRASLEFSKNDFVKMLKPSLAFLTLILTEIQKLELESDTAKAAQNALISALKAAREALVWAKQSEELTFQRQSAGGPIGEAVTSSEVISANLVTAFEMEEGLLTLSKPPVVSFGD